MNNFNIWIYDMEIIKDHVAIEIVDKNNEKIFSINTENMSKWKQGLDIIWAAKSTIIFVGYNNKYYDSLILDAMLILNSQGIIKKETFIKLALELSLAIIIKKEKTWDLRRGRGIRTETLQLDLMSGFIMGTLKTQGIRYHFPKLQLFDFSNFDKSYNDYSKVEKEKLAEYHTNDVALTHFIFTKNIKAIDIKFQMIIDYNLPIKAVSWTNAFIVENILSDPAISPPRETPFYNYLPMEWANFNNEELNKIVYGDRELGLPGYSNMRINYSAGEKIDRQIMWNDIPIKFALGGLHGSVKNYRGKNLTEIDANSFYSHIEILNNFFPPTMRGKGIEIYKKLLKERLADKENKSTKAEGKKLVLNTEFGVLNKPNSKLKSTEQMLNITITGQLMIMKLVEMYELIGSKVIYINTDGIIIEGEANEAVNNEWTNLMKGIPLENTKYKKAFIRDVNNYILQNENGEIKSKGVFNYSPGKKNNAYARIAWKSIEAFVINDVPLKDTINKSKDISDFVFHHKIGKASYTDFQIVEFDTEGNEKNIIPTGNEIRYVIGKEINNQFRSRQIEVRRKDGEITWKKPADATNIVLIDDLNSPPLCKIDKSYYLQFAQKELSKLTGEKLAKGENKETEKMIEKLKGRFN